MILLVGAGLMAKDYAKVLKAQGQDFVVIGRGEESARTFFNDTGVKVQTGGLVSFLENNSTIFDAAIVSVGVEQLQASTSLLINSGIKNVLVEKPAGLTISEIEQLAAETEKLNAKVFVAYNRRFYASVDKALEIIQQDGGVTSFDYELTEWGHVISTVTKADGVKENWFMGNTTHVVDLAFFLGGAPKEIRCFTSGSLDWHSRSSIYSGAGISTTGALFSYHGNWSAPGRWSVDVLTNKHRLIFRPMEKLQIQKLGSVALEFVEIDDSLDLNFKPGLYKQVESFLSGDQQRLCAIDEHLEKSVIYTKMAGY